MYEVQDRQENSVMFPKEARPPYLQDDAYFNTFTPEVALKAVMGWAQTMAVQKSNQLKEKKAEKASDLKTNTAVKMVDIKVLPRIARKEHHVSAVLLILFYDGRDQGAQGGHGRCQGHQGWHVGPG